MSDVADLLVASLAREIAEAEIDVYAVTSPATIVAALAARQLGAANLAIAGGFTALDAAPVPAVTLGERGMLSRGPAVRDWATDTFTLLARGRVGVAITPGQLDAQGRTNLSGIGDLGSPKVAFPGSYGLPDSGASPSRVWVVFGAHSARQLVDDVDFVSGPAPRPGVLRRLLTPAGCFELEEGAWRARWITPQGPQLVTEAPALGIELGGEEHVVSEADADARAAIEAADPNEMRKIEFAGGREAAELWSEAAAREARTAP